MTYHNQTLFVTVGTTRFDALITHISSESVLETIATQTGFTHLILQHGHSPLHPTLLSLPSTRTTLFETEATSITYSPTFTVTVFPFTNNINPFLSSANLVLSHAGTGSILESLRLLKPLIAVPNPILMHNHQLEIAQKMHSEGVLVCCESVTDIESILVDWKRLFKDVDPEKWGRGRAEGEGSRKVMRVVLEEAFS
ncbi:hypothetical protein BCR33DRAFT_725123 [Rhizoclosmatium globosum]|uniref:UDP-N-acetylglucosamine transferase subunit ALG13 n=1 Tax=Rhizoclosmatium globosum TaxID=329046 RepID=A0A1Y2B114_9FUNG|nr:hypothetical protein BCR33DRAFT_725123 [Rhizoclosmatium globosum]|eukprot:ORY28426.1 hypothetical protein BCR33DRAFT_725123 [Rhizoclosmatium globosum]